MLWAASEHSTLELYALPNNLEVCHYTGRRQLAGRIALWAGKGLKIAPILPYLSFGHVNLAGRPTHRLLYKIPCKRFHHLFQNEAEPNKAGNSSAVPIRLLFRIDSGPKHYDCGLFPCE